MESDFRGRPHQGLGSSAAGGRTLRRRQVCAEEVFCRDILTGTRAGARPDKRLWHRRRVEALGTPAGPRSIAPSANRS